MNCRSDQVVGEAGLCPSAQLNPRSMGLRTNLKGRLHALHNNSILMRPSSAVARPSVDAIALRAGHWRLRVSSPSDLAGGMGAVSSLAPARKLDPADGAAPPSGMNLDAHSFDVDDESRRGGKQVGRIPEEVADKCDGRHWRQRRHQQLVRDQERLRVQEREIAAQLNLRRLHHLVWRGLNPRGDKMAGDGCSVTLDCPEGKPIFTRAREDTMGAKCEALATQFEAKAKDAAAVLGKLTDADWKKGTAGEKWTVAATAHHLARSYEALASVIPMLASGGSLGGLTRAAADQQNDAQAKEHANCNRAETVALLQKGAAAAAPAIRGLSDEQLGKTVTVFADKPGMTIEQLVAAALFHHTDEHIGSILKTVGH